MKKFMLGRVAVMLMLMLRNMIKNLMFPLKICLGTRDTAVLMK